MERQKSARIYANARARHDEMSDRRPFGATNEHKTCLWCGTKLVTTYKYTHRHESDCCNAPMKGAICTSCKRRASYHVIREASQEVTAVMSELFCADGCAASFGEHFAKQGYRLS